MKTLGEIARVAIFGIVSVCFLLVAGGLVLFVSGQYNRWRDDPVFAERYFEGQFLAFETLESRAWNPSINLDCTYAIVRVPDLPTLTRRDLLLKQFAQSRYGRQSWQRGPVGDENQNVWDIVDFCERYWSAETISLFGKALEANSSWIWVSGKSMQSSVLVYAVETDFVAHVRYGD